MVLTFSFMPSALKAFHPFPRLERRRTLLQRGSYGTRSPAFPDRTFSNSFGGTSPIAPRGVEKVVAALFQIWFIHRESMPPTWMQSLPISYFTRSMNKCVSSFAFPEIHRGVGRE